MIGLLAMNNEPFSIDEILKQNFVKDLIKSTCGDEHELITRPASYLVRGTVESERNIYRVILLPPQGYTADKIDQMNSHDEAECATIEIKGAVREGKNSYSMIKNCLLVASIPKSANTNDLNKPYMKYDVDQKDNGLTLQKFSAGQAPFSVVSADGFGFYHNLVNLSDDWLVLRLYKRLRPSKQVDLNSRFQGLLKGQIEIFQKFYNAVIKDGDEVFAVEPNLINIICHMPISQSLPSLSEMLYVHDSGRHEACSIFAVMLKIGKMHPEAVIRFLEKAIIDQSIPEYYASQLLKKIERYCQQETASQLFRKVG